MNRLLKSLLLIVVIGVHSGCAMFNNGTLHYSRTITIGQELVELKTARDEGAISDEEYHKLKKEILEGDYFKVNEMYNDD